MSPLKTYWLSEKRPNGVETDVRFDVDGDSVTVTQYSGGFGVRQPHVEVVTLEEGRKSYKSWLRWGCKPVDGPQGPGRHHA